MQPRLARIWDWCLDLLFPRSCALCAREGELLCAACRAGLAFAVPTCPICRFRNGTGIVCARVRCRSQTELRRLLVPYSYRDPRVRELIHRFKYDGIRALDAILAEAAARFLLTYGIRLGKSTLLVPIPLHRARERSRGFNQSARLAHELGTRLGLKTMRTLRRVRATDPQVELDSFAARRTNVANAFAATDAGLVRGRRVMLVDDVSTSGATLEEAARVLRQAGARTVSAIAIAKG